MRCTVFLVVSFCAVAGGVNGSLGGVNGSDTGGDPSVMIDGCLVADDAKASVAEAAFWACLGPDANALGLTRNLFVDAERPLTHFDTPALTDSQICQCLPHLREAASCGHEVAGETVASFQPWCQLLPHCPDIVAPLLHTAYSCGTLLRDNETTVVCDTDPNATIVADNGDEDYSEHEHAGRCSAALADMFEATHPENHTFAFFDFGEMMHASTTLRSILEESNRTAETGTPTTSSAQAKQEETAKVKEQMKKFYRSMHFSAYSKIKDCLEDGSIAEGSLRLPVRIDDLFYNGTVNTYSGLKSHDCKHTIFFDEDSALVRWVSKKLENAENAWESQNTPMKAGEVGALVLLVLLCFIACYCCCCRSKPQPDLPKMETELTSTHAPSDFDPDRDD